MRGWRGGSGVGQQGLEVSLYPASCQALGMQQEMHEKTKTPIYPVIAPRHSKRKVQAESVGQTELWVPAQPPPPAHTRATGFTVALTDPNQTHPRALELPSACHQDLPPQQAPRAPAWTFKPSFSRSLYHRLQNTVL